MNLQLNLATRVYVDFRKVNLAIALSFFMVLAWLCIDLFVMTSNIREIRRLKGYVSNLHSKGGSGKISEAEYNRMVASIKIANGILDKKSYDWLTLLDNLEQVVPAGVSLNNLVPDAKGGALRISGAAVNFSALRKFIENLESSDKFTEVFLTDQANLKEGDVRKGVNFSVSCRALP